MLSLLLSLYIAFHKVQYTVQLDPHRDNLILQTGYVRCVRSSAPVEDGEWDCDRTNPQTVYVMSQTLLDGIYSPTTFHYEWQLAPGHYRAFVDLIRVPYREAEHSQTDFTILERE